MLPPLSSLAPATPLLTSGGCGRRALARRCELVLVRVCPSWGCAAGIRCSAARSAIPSALSVLRPGQMVTTRTTAHYKGDTMTGIIEAHYANGDVLKGKVTATRKKK